MSDVALRQACTVATLSLIALLTAAEVAMLDRSEPSSVYDIDTETWIEAARSYERLRLRHLRLSLAYVGSFFGFAVVFCFASAKNLPTLATALFLFFVPTMCMLGLKSFFCSFDLRSFRCPRCGERFAVSWRNQWPTNQCKHCQLDLGLTAAVKKKPSSLLDSLE